MEQKGEGIEVVKEPCRFYESSSEEDENFKDVYSTATLWDSRSHENQGESSTLISVPPLDKLTLAKASQQNISQNEARKNLVKVHGVTFRSVYDERTNFVGWSVNECHWKLPYDLINPELISSIPIDELPCVLSHKWNGHQIYIYEGEIVHILHPNVAIFLMQTILWQLPSIQCFICHK